MGDLVKVCKSCGRTLPYSAFNQDKAKADGRRNRCRECDAAYFQAKYADPEWRKLHTQRSKDRRKRLKSDDPMQLWAEDAVANAKQRARKYQLLCDIDLEHVRNLVVDTCPLLGLPILYAGSVVSDCSATLDRKNPTLGYTKGNIAVISHRANRLKSDSTIEELQLLLKNLVNYMESA